MERLLSVAIIPFFASILNAYVLHLNVPEVIVHNRYALYSKNPIQAKEQSDNLLPPDLLEEKYIQDENEEKEKALITSKDKVKSSKHKNDNGSSKATDSLKKKAKKFRNTVLKRAKTKLKKKKHAKGRRGKKRAGKARTSQENVDAKMYWFRDHEDKGLENTRIPLVDKDQDVKSRYLLGNSSDSSFEFGDAALVRSNVGEQSDGGIDGDVDLGSGNSSSGEEPKPGSNVQTGNYLNQKEEENEVLKKSESSVSTTGNGSIVDEDDTSSDQRVLINGNKIGQELSGSKKSTGVPGPEKTAGDNINNSGKNLTDVNAKMDFDGNGTEFNDSSAEKQDEPNVKEEDIDNIQTFDSSTEEMIPVQNASVKNVGKAGKSKAGLSGEGIDLNDLQSALTSTENDKTEHGAASNSVDKELNKDEGKENENDGLKNYDAENVDDNEYLDPSTEEPIDFAYSNSTKENNTQLNEIGVTKGQTFHHMNGSEMKIGNSSTQGMKVNYKANNATVSYNDTKVNQSEGIDLGEFSSTKSRNNIATDNQLGSAASESDGDSQGDNDVKDEFHLKPTPPVTLNAKFGKGDELSEGKSAIDAEQGSGEKNKVEFSQDTGANSDGKNQNGSDEFSTQEQPKAMGNTGKERSDTKIKANLGIFDQIDKEKNKLMKEVDTVLDKEFTDTQRLESLAESAENAENQMNEFSLNDTKNGPDLSDNENATDLNSEQLKSKNKKLLSTSNEGKIHEKSQGESYQLKTDSGSEDSDEKTGSSMKQELNGRDKVGKELKGDEDSQTESNEENGEDSGEFELNYKESKQDNMLDTWTVGPEILPKSEFGDQAPLKKTSNKAVSEAGHNDERDSKSSGLAPIANGSNSSVAKNDSHVKKHLSHDDAVKVMEKNLKKIKSTFEEMKNDDFKPNDEISVVNSKLNIAQHLYNEP